MAFAFLLSERSREGKENKFSKSKQLNSHKPLPFPSISVYRRWKVILDFFTLLISSNYLLIDFAIKADFILPSTRMGRRRKAVRKFIKKIWQDFKDLTERNMLRRFFYRYTPNPQKVKCSLFFFSPSLIDQTSFTERLLAVFPFFRTAK